MVLCALKLDNIMYSMEIESKVKRPDCFSRDSVCVCVCTGICVCLRTQVHCTRVC